MSGYRVADEPIEADPLAVDEELVRRQRYWNRFVVQGAVVAMTVGLWIPGMLAWMALAPGWIRAWAAGYAVKIQRGTLVIGNANEMRTVPLDAIADVAIHKGYVTVSVRGGAGAQILGLRDPVAASQAILAARDEALRSLRTEVREELMEEPVGAATARKQR